MSQDNSSTCQTPTIEEIRKTMRETLNNLTQTTNEGNKDAAEALDLLKLTLKSAALTDTQREKLNTAFDLVISSPEINNAFLIQFQAYCNLLDRPHINVEIAHTILRCITRNHKCLADSLGEMDSVLRNITNDINQEMSGKSENKHEPETVANPPVLTGAHANCFNKQDCRENVIADILRLSLDSHNLINGMFQTEYGLLAYYKQRRDESINENDKMCFHVVVKGLELKCKYLQHINRDLASYTSEELEQYSLKQLHDCAAKVRRERQSMRVKVERLLAYNLSLLKDNASLATISLIDSDVSARPQDRR